MVPVRVTTGGVNGPMNSPHAPAECSIAARAGGVKHNAATMGITIGASMAFAPARVPSSATRVVEAIMTPS